MTRLLGGTVGGSFLYVMTSPNYLTSLAQLESIENSARSVGSGTVPWCYLRFLGLLYKASVQLVCRALHPVLISSFRRERRTRVAIFFGGAALAGAFGGILAFAINKMDGIDGRAGWQW